MEEAEINIAYIWATLLGIGGNRSVRMLEQMFGSVTEAYVNKEYEERLKSVSDGFVNIPDAFFENVRKQSVRDEAKRIYENAVKKGMRITVKASERYPRLLQNAAGSPILIYSYGRLPDMPMISVVGSRKCSAYGKGAAELFVSALSELGIGIVSGMARGIDRAAHRAALARRGFSSGNNNAGYTVAVLGCGCDVCYPRENADIYEEIKATGCIISEYPPGASPLRSAFPARNRIISGLSSGTLVIEAGKKSGANITAGYTAEMGRDVFVVPGNIDSPYSEGSNELIKSGAICVTSPGDIIDSMENGGEYIFDMLKLSDENCKQNSRVSECKITGAIREGAHSDETISSKTGIPQKELRIELLQLEIDGIIERTLQGTYYLRIK